MATSKIALKIRSVTYPTYDSKNKVKQKNPLQRMSSFDSSDESRLIVREESRRRELSVEGRTKGKFFQNSHSCSSDTTTSCSSNVSARQRSLGYSQDNSFVFDEIDRALSAECDLCDSFVHSPKSRKGYDYGVILANNTERLLDWRKKSPDRRGVGRSRSYDVMHRHCRSPDRRTIDKASGARRRRLCTSTSVPPPETTSSTEKYHTEETSQTAGNNAKISNEGRRRRSQFRRALSVFSLTCSSKDIEKDRRESKSPQKKILRPPTRHVYRRGLSGLPVECSSKYLGLAY